MDSEHSANSLDQLEFIFGTLHSGGGGYLVVHVLQAPVAAAHSE